MALMESSSGSGVGRGRTLARWLGLAALLALVAVAFADSSIVVLALPDLLRQFDVSITSVAWVVTAYNLSLAVVAIAYARMPSRSRHPARTERIGALVFLAASVGCAVASSVWLLVGFRVVQGAGAALVLVAALPLIRSLASTPQTGTALWAGAGVFGAALGPALGGVLTDVFSWRAIFFAQAPIAALALIAAVAVRGKSADLLPLERPVGPRRHAASLALALASAALVGLLFLAVVQLIDVWRLTPLAAAAVVSVIPLATLLAQPLAARLGSGAATTGAILLAAGLAGMGFLPARSLVWVIAALAIAGAGLGLLLPGLTHRVLSDVGPSTTGAAHAVWIRHAGLVAGILLLTPLLATDLTSAGQSAKLRGISVVLDAPVSVTTKARLALDLAPALAQPTRKQLPDFASTLRSQHDPALTRMGHELDQVVQATITRGFRRSYLLAALLALLALAPLALLRHGDTPRRSPRAAAVALAVAAALVGAELAGGAQAFGARPRLQPPCATRSSSRQAGTDGQAQQLALAGLDLIACQLHKSREQLLLDTANWGYKARTNIGKWAHQLHLPFG
ncbi:MAG: MFS transporter [Solirubrobacteraceae bacterium]